MMENTAFPPKCRVYTKKCFVPGCNSSEEKTPTKIFVRLPGNTETRRQWAEAVGLTGKKTIYSVSSSIFCCEDHFNLEEDMENWMKYKLMGGQIRMKKGVVPRFLLSRKKTEIENDEDANSDSMHIFDNTKIQQDAQKISSNTQINSLQARTTSKQINHASRKPRNVIQKQVLEPRELVQVKSEVNMEVDEGEEDPLNLDNMLFPERHQRFFRINHNHDCNHFQDFADQLEPMMRESEEGKTVTVTPLTYNDISNWISEIKGTMRQPEAVASILEGQNPTDLMLQSFPLVDNYVPNEIIFSLPVEKEANPVRTFQMVNGNRRVPRILKPKTRMPQIPQTSQGSQIVTIPTLQVMDTTCTPPIAPLILNTEENIIKVSNLQKISKKIGTDLQIWKRKTDVQDKETQVEENFFTGVKKQDMNVEALTNMIIVRKPYLYTGLYGNVFSGFTNMILNRSNESYKDVLMTLMKIRLDDSFRRLEDIFGIVEGEAGEIFEKLVPNLAIILKDLIFRPDKEVIGTTLPIQFRSCYKKMHSVIDYFRIKTHISGDWRHDNCESIKFLISCTIDDGINFVSPGYQEEEKDSAVLTNSGFLNKLQVGTTVIANRNFFGIDEMLKQKHCTFIEPDSQEETFSGISAESIAGSREKLNLILDSLRKFEYIGPKACIPRDALGHLNQVMIIASAIVNTHRRNRSGSKG